MASKTKTSKAEWVNNRKLKSLLAILKEARIDEFSYNGLTVKFTSKDGTDMSLSASDSDLMDTARTISTEDAERREEEQLKALETWSA